MNKQHDNRRQLELVIAAGAPASEAKKIDPAGELTCELLVEEEFLRKVYAQRCSGPKVRAVTFRFYVLWIAAALLATAFVLASLQPDEEDPATRKAPSASAVMIVGEETEPAIVINVPSDTRGYGVESLREMLREDMGEARFDTCVWIFEERQIRVQNADEAMIEEVKKLLAGYTKEISGVVTLECKVYDIPWLLCDQEIIAGAWEAGSAFLDQDQEKALERWLLEQGLKTEMAPRVLLLSRQRGHIALHGKEVSYIKSYVVNSTPKATTLDPVIDKAISGHQFSFRCKPSEDGKFVMVSMHYENIALGDLIKTKKVVEVGPWTREAVVEIPEINALGLDYNVNVPNDSAVLLQLPIADAAIAANAARFGIVHVNFSKGK